MATAFRRKPELRKEEIITAAMIVAQRDGFNNLQREAVAQQAQCANGSVNRYFGNMNQLRNAVMRRAVKSNPPVLSIVATGLAMNHTQAVKAPDDVKQAAIKSLAE